MVIGEGPERARLERLAGPSVRFLGWQPDEVIRDHYRRCRALLFPGEEDFGIVPIEALACEAPVIALARGGAAETVDTRWAGPIPTPPRGPPRALDAWEADGRPHDPPPPGAGPRRFALPIFRRRLLGYLAEVAQNPGPTRAIPTPHLPLVP